MSGQGNPLPAVFGIIIFAAGAIGTGVQEYRLATRRAEPPAPPAAEMKARGAETAPEYAPISIVALHFGLLFTAIGVGNATVGDPPAARPASAIVGAVWAAVLVLGAWRLRAAAGSPWIEIAGLTVVSSIVGGALCGWIRSGTRPIRVKTRIDVGR